MSDRFTVTATDGAARAGALRTAHGGVPTPAFMPVGTKTTVRTLYPDVLRALGTTILLGNTYHLHFRPGEDVIAELGGLHRFMAWDAPILTDSGGFQVFSLRDTIAAVDDEGVTFRSVYDGALARFTPESVAECQAKLGSDIAMCLDICPPVEIDRAELAEAVRRTTLWATRQLAAPRADGQLLFGIAQGASDAELRRRSIAELSELDFDGYALGGLAIGEDRGLMFETTAWGADLLPSEYPRYFMGIGDPEGILEVIERGVDLFDCVLPTAAVGGGPMGRYIFILILLVGMWFLLIRPQRRRQMEAQRLVQSLEVGKEIVTAGGLYGTITALEADEARVQIADGVEVRIAKRAIAGVLSEDEEPRELEEEGAANLP